MNNTVDKRFSKPGAPAHAKNQAAINAGRQEIETGQFAHHQQPPAPDPRYQPYSPDSNAPYNQTPSGTSVPGSQIEPEGKSTGGKLGGFMKKMKEGPLNSQRMDGRDNRLHVVNE